MSDQLYQMKSKTLAGGERNAAGEAGADEGLLDFDVTEKI